MFIWASNSKNSQQHLNICLIEVHVKQTHIKVAIQENLGKNKKIRKISNFLPINLVESC